MKEHLHLYTIDMKYVRNLAKVDQNVMSVSPQLGKDIRPFVGILILVNDKKYCVPLSSPKAKFQNKKNAIDFMRIIDESQKTENGMGKIIGALNFNNMLPVENVVLTPIDLRIKQNDTGQTKSYKSLLSKQLDWCQKNEEKLISHANRTYEMVTKYPEKSRSLVRRCCNFKKLEQVLEKYLGKNRIEDGYLIEIKSPEQLTALKASGIPFQKAETSDGTIIVKVRQEGKDAAKNTVRNVQGKKL